MKTKKARSEDYKKSLEELKDEYEIQNGEYAIHTEDLEELGWDFTDWVQDYLSGDEDRKPDEAIIEVDDTATYCRFAEKGDKWNNERTGDDTQTIIDLANLREQDKIIGKNLH